MGQRQGEVIQQYVTFIAFGGHLTNIAAAAFSGRDF